MNTTIVPHRSTHPGVILKNELDSREFTQKEFAQSIDMPVTMLNEIIKGKRSVTADIALVLEKSLDIPADFWLGLQTQYELDEARLSERNIQKAQQIEKWNVISQYVPVKTFSKLGVLVGNMAANIQKIWSIYGVSNLDELIDQFACHEELVLYKKSEKLKNNPVSIFGWSRLAMYTVSSKPAKEFAPQKEQELTNLLKAIFHENKNVVVRCEHTLSEYGIRFMTLEKFEQTPIDGFSFWSGSNPAIVLTLRKKTLDNFAFALFHELGHVFKHLNPDSGYEFLNIEDVRYSNERARLEDEADCYAKNTFIEEQIWSTFIKRNSSFKYGITERNIIGFASEQYIHPSIVFGRYCFETNNFAIKTKIDRTLHT